MLVGIPVVLHPSSAMTRRRQVHAGSKTKIQLTGTRRHERATTVKMKEIFKLPEPKNKGIIKQIIGPKGENLRHMEKKARIKPYDIRQKKNEVHIIGSEEQVEQIKTFLNEIIEKELKRQEEAKDKAAHIRGSHINKIRAAKKIEDILNKSTTSTDGKIKVSLPPNCELGRIFGQQFCNIDKIKRETGACVEEIKNAIYISGEASKCKKAIIMIKSKAADVCNKKPPPEQYNFLHATGQCADDYKLQEFDCPNPSWNGEKHFKVYRIDEDKGVQHTSEDLNTEELQKFLCEQLKKVQAENADQKVKAELFCHFGHLYIGNIDEELQKKTYELSDLKKEFKKDKKKESWRLRFDPAIKELEFKQLEEDLQNCNNGYKCTVDPHIRHDFQFYTPSCTSIRAKIFMDMDGNIDPKFSHQDIDIRKHGPKQVSSASPAPKYVLCDQLLTRARVNIMILSKGMDCRLAIRTVSPTEDQTGKAEIFEKDVTKYLDNVSIVNKEVCMPGDSEMPGNPGDYCLYYWRKCHRRSYPYKADGEEFSITISEEDVMDVTGSGQQECKTVDIHLHCDEWDRLLTSGKWEPEQIVEKLPQFLNFVRDVQANISEPPDKKY
ncbi:uncharacterized protein LOC116295202 isoform X2 [Actinia tenebrosa]|uniref:Uncharacterized protein LOC116295202 isoform X2 n=1 Tax=Actinia tenebrosa TaxID=6105 RepID=A0A6P8HR22_ACTTE|nr:uncharacterized protein LOC116295202 isoform X2 [Actinia tenebrosa]